MRKKEMGVTLLNIDCMKYLSDIPDKYFELAVTDPPYGNDAGNKINFRESRTYQDVITKYRKGDWDLFAPDEKYFSELFRVSKNQIIWGANHFTPFLPPSRGWCYWDKGYTSENLSYSDAELAFTSFDRTLKRCKLKMSDWRNCTSNNRRMALANPNLKIHPCQKPIALYRWLFHNYGKEGDKILDTHLGSASSAIAAHQMGFEFVGTEIDKGYYEDGSKRFRKLTTQKQLF